MFSKQVSLFAHLLNIWNKVKLQIGSIHTAAIFELKPGQGD